MIICPFCGAENIEGVDECAKCGQSLSDLHLQPPSTEVERSLLRDRVAALQPREPITVRSTEPVSAVLKQMVGCQIGCVLVYDEQQQLAGIFSERDALIRLNDKAAELGDQPISEFMTPVPHTLATDVKIAFAVQRMDLGGYRHVPIVDDEGQVSGVVSVRDILRYLTDKMMVDGVA